MILIKERLFIVTLILVNIVRCQEYNYNYQPRYKYDQQNVQQPFMYQNSNSKPNNYMDVDEKLLNKNLRNYQQQNIEYNEQKKIDDNKYSLVNLAEILYTNHEDIFKESIKKFQKNSIDYIKNSVMKLQYLFQSNKTSYEGLMQCMLKTQSEVVTIVNNTYDSLTNCSRKYTKEITDGISEIKSVLNEAKNSEYKEQCIRCSSDAVSSYLYWKYYNGQKLYKIDKKLQDLSKQLEWTLLNNCIHSKTNEFDEKLSKYMTDIGFCTVRSGEETSTTIKQTTNRTITEATTTKIPLTTTTDAIPNITTATTKQQTEIIKNIPSIKPPDYLLNTDITPIEEKIMSKDTVVARTVNRPRYLTPLHPKSAKNDHNKIKNGKSKRENTSKKGNGTKSKMKKVVPAAGKNKKKLSKQKKSPGNAKLKNDEKKIKKN